MKTIKTHGRTFSGVVTSNKMSKTVSVEWGRRHYIPKYERYEKRKTVVKAHTEIECEIGDVVVIQETRPLSKTKHFIVVKKLDEGAIAEKTEGNVESKEKKEQKAEKEVPAKKKVVAKKTVKKAVKKTTKKTPLTTEEKSE